MSNPGNKKGAPKKVPKSGRKKNGTRETTKEASRMTGVSQMATAPGVSKNASVALSVSSGVRQSNTGSRRAKKVSKRKPSMMSKPSSSNVSTASKVESKEEDEAADGKKKEIPITMFTTNDGKNLKIHEHLRNPKSHGEFAVKDDKDANYILRFEPMKRGKLRFTSDILLETAQLFTGNDKVPVVRCIEYGANNALGSNYLLMSSYSLQIAEVLKIVGSFTPGCVFNIALQCLEAIQYLHQAGFINRNIKPSTYSIGSDDQETKVMLTDFRLARAHIETVDGKKKVRAARPHVKYGGTARYASIAGLKEQDQGRKDDLESWIYIFYELLDPEQGLSWRKMPRCNMLIKEKENFKQHLLPNTYKKVPVEFKKIVDIVHSYNYESVPDYAAIKEIVVSVGQAKEYDLTVCDWSGKVTAASFKGAIKQAEDRSTGNRCSGNDDFEFKKKRPVRKMMNPNDVIKNGQFTWKVVSLLGSGGFGDVYKVFDQKNKSKHYALKTESEDGKKVMLRLKVEMQVLMAIQEARKSCETGANRHFVEFVDRGKSDDLKCKFIVMSLVGPSLDDIRKKYKVQLNEDQTPFIIAIQSLEAVRDLHNLGYLHRDIKPANFAVGVGPTEPTVFMLDFGIGRSFLDPATKQHRAPRKSVKFLGTLRYASRACMKGIDQGRKDDLECWIYMIFDIFDPKDAIFWRNVTGRDKITLSKEIFFSGKMNNRRDKVPGFLKSLLPYVDNMKFQSLPDYQHMVRILNTTADKCGKSVRDINSGAWVGNLELKKGPVRFDESTSESEKVSNSGEEEEN